ncbi:INGR1 protein, partial [Penelope pileata]|nr:INGR1 protein [Penelope pileata]
AFSFFPPQSKDVIFVDNCNMSKCSKNIPVPYEDSTFCLSAQGSFYDNLISSAPSEESCIQVPLKWTWSSQDAIIVCVVVLIVGLILTVCCGFKKLRKKNIKLPKSLVSVIRNLNADNSLESKSEAKDISVVSVMPVSSINDDEALLTVESEGETVSPESSSGGASSGLPLEASDKVEETSVQESAKEIPSDNEQNCEVKESIFISDSNQTDVCSNSSGPEVSATEIRQAVIPTSCLKFSGYDKPHVPLDMLIDVGEEQPVIAYRPTE